MSNDKKKLKKDIQEAQEQFHFELFKKRYEEWRDGEEKRGKDKEPDFLIKYPDETLGIELTAPYKPEGQGQVVSPQKREGSLRKIVNNARRFYEERNNPHLKVDVWFSPTFEKTQITGKKAKELSQQLAKFVEKELPSANSPGFLIEQPKGYLPEIYNISITSGVPKQNAQWTKQKPVWMKADFVADLQKSINDKNEKYEQYIVYCNECWLLMVADKWNPPQAFDVDFSGKVTDHTYQSQFSKTFYLEVTDESLIELKTTC